MFIVDVGVCPIVTTVNLHCNVHKHDCTVNNMVLHYSMMAWKSLIMFGKSSFSIDSPFDPHFIHFIFMLCECK